MNVLSEGADAPDFTLPDQNGEDFSMEAQRGKTIVLYFYPRADTPGCTTQACSARDRTAEYEKVTARIVGISPDSVSDVSRFAGKYDLGFTLLADEDHAVADQFGTWGEKSMYGKTFMGVQRATFIIDPEGKIAKVFPKVSPKTHDVVVLEALADLTPA